MCFFLGCECSGNFPRKINVYKRHLTDMENSEEGCLECIIKKPISLRIGSPSVDFKSGCSVVDVSFPTMEPVEKCFIDCEIKLKLMLCLLGPKPSHVTILSVPYTIGCISFINNYTASVSLKFRTSDDTWKICLRNFELMPSAHCEEGSQSKITIKTHQMIQPIKDAVLLRIILRQPSPHWLNFSIEHLSFYPPAQVSSHLSNVLSSVEQEDNNESEENSQVVDIANKLQQMWALTETVSVDEDELEEPPHFDIDGCYDLNLLSYT